MDRVCFVSNRSEGCAAFQCSLLFVVFFGWFSNKNSLPSCCFHSWPSGEKKKKGSCTTESTGFAQAIAVGVRLKHGINYIKSTLMSRDISLAWAIIMCLATVQFTLCVYARNADYTIVVMVFNFVVNSKNNFGGNQLAILSAHFLHLLPF